jgi:DNA-binding transcriptional LysR family regulator
MLLHRQVEAFRAVMVAGGVTRAARSMHITQPAVSRLIHEMEAALGLTLFTRQGTGVRPTAEALALFEEVERSFVGLERIQRVALNLRESGHTLLRLATQPMLSNQYLPRFLGRFLRDHRDIEVRFVALPTSLIVEGTAEGRFDIGMAAMPVVYRGLAVEQAPATSMVAVLPLDHPLARKRVLEPEDFEGQPFIAIGEHALPRLRLDALFAERGVTRQIRAESPLHHVVCSLVAEGVGLAVVERLAAEDFRDKGIAVRGFSPTIESAFGVLYSDQRPPTAPARMFIDSLLHDIATSTARWNATEPYEQPPNARSGAGRAQIIIRHEVRR